MFHRNELLVIIPSRYGSKRLPGKPLKLIQNKPMIQHVYERINKKFNCVIATDSELIVEAVKKFNGRVVMTSESCRNGTIRCIEAIKVLRLKGNIIPKYIVNVQGDEPLININHIEKLASNFIDSKFDIGTLCAVASQENLNSKSNSYVVFNSFNKAIFFSRYPIPYNRENKNIDKFKHVGVYIFKSKILNQLDSLEISKLEDIESLEQLGWLEKGYDIQVTVVENDGATSVDTLEDLKYVRKLFKKNFDK